jgi:hypothetical protein
VSGALEVWGGAYLHCMPLPLPPQLHLLSQEEELPKPYLNTNPYDKPKYKPKTTLTLTLNLTLNLTLTLTLNLTLILPTP